LNQQKSLDLKVKSGSPKATPLSSPPLPKSPGGSENEGDKVVSSTVGGTVKKALMARAEVYANALERMPGFKDKTSWVYQAKDRVILPSNRFMVNPSGSLRVLWDLGVIMPILLYLTIMLPFRICFDNEPVNGTPMFWVEIAIEMVSLSFLAVNGVVFIIPFINT
jgi:hypothetical protein